MSRAAELPHSSRRARRLRWSLVGAVIPVASCHQTGVLDPQGPVASAERLLLINATAIMLVVVIPVIVATLAFIWRYRSSNTRAVSSTDESYEGRIELVVWSIPALTVVLLGGVIWIGSHELDPRAPIRSEAKALHIDVVALDWKWLFIYPDQGVATVNILVIPAGTPVEFRLTSATVMNSFFVPQLGSQIYTMGGMTTHLSLLAAQPGEYPGFSANFSGDGFAWMRFIAKSVRPTDFNSWLDQARGTGNALDEASYAELAKPFEHIIDLTTTGLAGKPGGSAALHPPPHQAGG
jgi:cytochrome o ubiquinol oxidase subunit 2